MSEPLVGDARGLPFEEASLDVALLLGPLYHLAEREDRLRALGEAIRVVKPGGWVIAAAIPRLARLVAMSGGAGVPRGWKDLIEHGSSPAVGRFPGGHFHTSGRTGRGVERCGVAGGRGGGRRTTSSRSAGDLRKVWTPYMG
ncbi:class I SAM-dependent methyltransferase [Nocardioides sp. NPDC058538]|uniref:class I SAM-dependent methyltransferase n=1 Tax=Nocardioides sp. NPDC058538 TaxID=3346542 RepID=UPI003659AE7B